MGEAQSIGLHAWIAASYLARGLRSAIACVARIISYSYMTPVLLNLNVNFFQLARMEGWRGAAGDEHEVQQAEAGRNGQDRPMAMEPHPSRAGIHVT